MGAVRVEKCDFRLSPGAVFVWKCLCCDRSFFDMETLRNWSEVSMCTLYDWNVIIFGSSLAYIVIESRDVERPVWNAQSICHSFVCCCSQRLVAGDRVHCRVCTCRGNSLFFIHLFLVSHVYGHSLSMLSIGLGCMAGVPLVGRS